MMKWKNRILVILVAAFLGGFGLWSVILKDQEISVSERRELAQAPELSWDSLISGKYMNAFEEYVLDQFPMRDTFLGLKNDITEKVLFQKNADYYVADGYAAAVESRLNEESIAYAAERFRFLYDKYLADTDVNIYLSIIPDKNFFLAKPNGYLTMDYAKLAEQMQASMEYASYIDLFPYLDCRDYYYTDTHWRQENILQVAEVLGQQMGVSLSSVYETRTIPQPFYGYYYNLVNQSMEPDTIRYLTNDVLEQAVVFDYETNRETDVYTLQRAEGDDPYEIFLGGPKSLLTIENERASTDKELIVFRDSFGSSLAPLLVEGYRKITLIDIRYIVPAMLGRFVTFDDQDVLFLYNAAVLNHSETLK